MNTDENLSKQVDRLQDGRLLGVNQGNCTSAFNLQPKHLSIKLRPLSASPKLIILIFALDK